MLFTQPTNFKHAGQVRYFGSHMHIRPPTGEMNVQKQNVRSIERTDVIPVFKWNEFMGIIQFVLWRNLRVNEFSAVIRAHTKCSKKAD
jgi:hypothetical protein